MSLVLEYVATVYEIDNIQDTDFDNKKTVKTNNKLAERLRVIAFEIDSEYPELKPNFYQLLFHEKSTVRLWVAHHILEVMNYDDECRRTALKEIKYIVKHDRSIEGLGNKMWLKEWYKKHPEDKRLL